MVLNKFYFKETNAKKVKETHLFLYETLQEINFTLKRKTETVRIRKGWHRGN